MICDELWKHRIGVLAISVRNLAKRNNNEKALQYKKIQIRIICFPLQMPCYRDLPNNMDRTAQTVQAFFVFIYTLVSIVLERTSFVLVHLKERSV
jgi:hypothetical protein